MRYIRAEKQALKKEIMEKKALDDDLKAKLNEAITAFKKTFSA
jgi:F0F1-type ATP synthase alpha subunit